MKKIKINKDFSFSNDSNIKFILGPCQIESQSHAFDICAEITKLSKKLKFKFIYKSSFDKANRSSHKSKRGVGIRRGLEILSKVKEKYNCPVISDIHEISQIKEAKRVLDIIQIPAFLSRQTDLLIEAGKSGVPINVKKGQFLAPWDMKNVIRKVYSSGNNKILITERGTSFGYNNLVSDMRSIKIIKEFGYPIIFDATHSVQLPGGMGNKSGGQSEFVDTLATASTTVGISGIFMETHENPKKAPSDGPNMVALKDLGDLIHKIILYDNLTKSKVLKNVRNF